MGLSAVFGRSTGNCSDGGHMTQVFLDDVRTAACRLADRYYARDVAKTAACASAHLRTLAEIAATASRRPAANRRPAVDRDLAEAQAMFGAIRAASLIDQDRHADAITALQTAAMHAQRIGDGALAAHIAGIRAQAALMHHQPGLALAVLARHLPATGSPSASGMLALAARAYALMGDQTNAAAAIRRAHAVAERADAPSPHAMAFRGPGRAEVAVIAVDTYARIGDRAAAGRIAQEWLPTLAAAEAACLANHLKASYAMAVASTEPDLSAALIGEAISAAARFGKLSPAATGKVRYILAHAPQDHPARRNIAESARTVT
jgi:hypothetical protein